MFTSPRKIALELRRTHYPAGHRMPPHRDGTARISILLRGVLHEHHGGHGITVRAGAWAYKGADNRHETRFGPQPVSLLSLDLGELAASVHQEAWVWQQGPLSARRICRLVGRLAEPEALEQAVFDLLGELDQQAGPPGDPPRWLQILRQEIDDTTDASSTKILAAKVGCHPVYLARCFRRYYGLSISEYQAWWRVLRCLAQWQPHMGLAALAQEMGFYDQSHMVRHFRQILGTSPNAFYQRLSDLSKARP